MSEREWKPVKRAPLSEYDDATDIADHFKSMLMSMPLVQYGQALEVVSGLSTDKTVQAKIIRMGAQAYAAGMTPPMLDVFARIAARGAIYGRDLRDLRNFGIKIEGAF